jgi:hypothetical protein
MQAVPITDPHFLDDINWWCICFNQAFCQEDHNEVGEWIANNGVDGYSHDRGDNLGPSGEVLFRSVDDAVLFMLWLGY